MLVKFIRELKRTKPYPAKADFTTYYCYKEGEVLGCFNSEQYFNFKQLQAVYDKSIVVEKSFDKESYTRALKEYYEEETELDTLFFEEAFKKLNLDQNHPKAARLKELSKTFGQGAGYDEVFYYLEELSSLIR